MSLPCGARRAIAYVRVPSAPIAEDAEGEAAQRAAIAEWARRAGVEVRSWEIDVADGVTPIAERPGLLAAYASIRAHRAGILVAANAERFSRDELVAWLIERAALTAGAALETADGSRPRPPAGRLEPDVAYSRSVLELARAHERVVFRERVRSALARKKARGERVGNVRFGYRLAADGVHVEPDPREQAVVREVCQLAKDGLSQRAIAARLAAAGIVGRTGSPLGQTQIATILRAAR